MSLLCLLEPGMTLSTPDEWIERKILGSRQHRARLVDRIAGQFGCSIRQEIGACVFEKLDTPATG